MSVQVMLNGVPLDHYSSSKTFNEEANGHHLYRPPHPKYRSRKEKSGPVRHLTREEIRAEYGVEQCPYTWEEVYTWLNNLLEYSGVLGC